MAYCTKCGTSVPEQANACPQCGAGQTPTQAPTGGTAPQAGGQSSGMSETTAATLSYLVGWVTGIIFLLIDKRPFVRFHAAQSLVTFGAIHVVRQILKIFFGVQFFRGGWHLFGPLGMTLHAMSLLTLILWIVLMVKAHQGERYRLPVAAEIADGIAGK